MVLEEIATPIVLAPLAGGPSTPELTAAVCEAGGLGFLAFGYLPPDDAAARLAAVRSLTARPFGVNLFVPGEPSQLDVSSYVARLGPGAGEPRWDDDEWEQKLALLRAEPPAVVSFTFGCPSSAVLASLPCETWVTVTRPAEALQAVEAGADAVVVQGAEAGGHRGSFADDDDAPLPLLELLRATAGLPVPRIAAGGIATAEDTAAALEAGAAAVQAGTAFLLCPQAGTAEVVRRAVASDRPTALTRAFTGRLARGIVNRFMEEHSAVAPSAYPELHHATAPLRAEGRAAGDESVVNLWAGERHALARAVPAAEVVRALSHTAPPRA
ncbi:MAG TPA: nitronate monooxygenase [Solirubrobacteraceae bacterium]